MDARDVDIANIMKLQQQNSALLSEAQRAHDEVAAMLERLVALVEAARAGNALDRQIGSSS
jgi:hypothetical protein